MNLTISDVNVGEYDVETGKTIRFKVDNPNDAKATIENIKHDDPRATIQMPLELKPFQKVTGVIRIPLVDNVVPDDLDEIEDLVTMQVKFLK
jgi:hypothetical protein